MKLLARSVLIGAWCSGLVAASSGHAEVTLPAIFGDHMVLQEAAKLPVWGKADPGETVTVSVGDEKATATADAAGKWRVDLPPLPAGGAPVTLTVAGAKKTLTLTDVLVGEVWLCSGQSNMEFGIGMDARKTETIAQATDPEIRLFMVPHQTSLEPKETMATGKPLEGKWQVCSPEVMGGKWGWGGFSAVGYYFGREIRQATGKPVGLIESTWGGTPAQAWTSLSGLRKDAELKEFVDAYETTAANFAVAKADYPVKMATHQKDVAAWEAAGGAAFEAKMKIWQAAARQASAAGLPPPADKPTYAKSKPAPPREPDGGPHSPTNLYNGMIAPLLPFAIKGAIWYQGESNADAAAQYRVLFKRMINDWREKWGEGNFPFFWVQLAGFKASPVQNWPFLREAQAQTLVLPATGMATAIDVGNPNDIHPADKFDVGHRLALVVEDMVYGQSGADAGPIYAGMTKQGGAITLRFANVGGGLVIGKAPWAPSGVAPLPTDHLVGFTIAGPDKTFVPAEAKIVGDTVVVSSAQQPLPEAVRYDWANAPEGNFYNADGMPAFPFRTDDWVDPVAMGTAPPAAKAK